MTMIRIRIFLSVSIPVDHYVLDLVLEVDVGSATQNAGVRIGRQFWCDFPFQTVDAIEQRAAMCTKSCALISEQALSV